MTVVLVICVFLCCFASKTDSKLQRRPRSTSMKDRQNSKAQSDRTNSIESETSPDSRLITQVCVSVCVCVQHYYIRKLMVLLCKVCLITCFIVTGSEEISLRSAESDPELRWTSARKHHSHQHYRLARTGVCGLLNNIFGETFVPKSEENLKICTTFYLGWKEEKCDIGPQNKSYVAWVYL